MTDEKIKEYEERMKQMKIENDDRVEWVYQFINHLDYDDQLRWCAALADYSITDNAYGEWSNPIIPLLLWFVVFCPYKEFRDAASMIEKCWNKGSEVMQS